VKAVTAAISNSRRFATVAAALAVVFAGFAVAWLAGFGSASVNSTGTAPIVDHRTPSLAADAQLADAPQAGAIGKTAAGHTAVGDAGLGNTVMATAAPTVTDTDTTAGKIEQHPIAEVAPTDSSHAPSPETPPVQVATANPSDLLPDHAKDAVSPSEILGECGETDTCIDQYLWALYQRTPKEDTIKVREQRRVTVKKKRKRVTVTKTFIKLVDEDFAWKDPAAAKKAGMPMMAYVIGGMDRSFKLKLFHALRAADEAGLSPGITSAFRDDYRQSLASGLKAATNRSYHGGSLRGGYGHGLAADVVSVKGETRDQRWASSEVLWEWIDAHGKEFGIGRPYLDRDPAHMAPIDGQEYAAHHRETKTRHAASGKKKHHRLTAR
jgi:hypothetical protein